MIFSDDLSSLITFCHLHNSCILSVMTSNDILTTFSNSCLYTISGGKNTAPINVNYKITNYLLSHRLLSELTFLIKENYWKTSICRKHWAWGQSIRGDLLSVLRDTSLVCRTWFSYCIASLCCLSNFISVSFWTTKLELLIKAKVAAPRVLFVHLSLHSFDYNRHVEGFLLANLCLVTLLSSE